MFKKALNELECPSCLSVHKFSGGAADLSKLIKNFTLLSLVEAAKTPTPSGNSKGGQRLTKSKTTLGHSSYGGAFTKDLDDLEECKSEEEQIEYLEDGSQSLSKKKGPPVILPPRIHFN